MIQIKDGNIFASTTEAIVNPVNCVGVMGAGMAKRVKLRHPDLFYAYKQQCLERKVKVGKVQVFETPNKLKLYSKVLNLPTKKHWHDKDTLVYLKLGLENLKTVMREKKIRSVTLPMFGTDLGDLEEESVLKLIKRIFNKSKSLIIVNKYKHVPDPYTKLVVSFLKHPNLDAKIKMIPLSRLAYARSKLLVTHFDVVDLADLDIFQHSGEIELMKLNKEFYPNLTRRAVRDLGSR